MDWRTLLWVRRRALRPHRTIWLIFSLLCGLTTRSHAQPAGSLDLNFHPAINVGTDIYAVTLQTNGQILIGGSFTSVEDLPRANVARLNADGTLDPSFDPGTAADLGYVNSIAIQNDGKILAGGFFYSSMGLDSGMLTRLNPDGTLDDTFDPYLYIDAPVNAVLVQPDGKILLGGSFVTIDFLVRRSVARLEANGTLDYGFDACVASSEGNGATALGLQPDGKILASGTFSFSTGYSRNGIARLGDCGELDPSYAPEPGVDSTNIVSTLALQPGGTVLMGGNFRSFHLTPRGGIAQVTTEGLVDPDFDPGTGIDAKTAVYAVAFQKNGQMIIGGTFESYNKQPKASVARINFDGSLDPSYGPELGPDNAISSMALQKNGALIVGGRFTSFDGVPRNGIARLNADPPSSRLGLPTQIGDGLIQFTLYGDPDAKYTVQGSTNLAEWVSFTRVAATADGVSIVDSNAPSYSRRFYRAILK